MANHEKLEEYDPQEEWDQYIEQLEFYSKQMESITRTNSEQYHRVCVEAKPTN